MTSICSLLNSSNDWLGNNFRDMSITSSKPASITAVLPIVPPKRQWTFPKLDKMSMIFLAQPESTIPGPCTTTPISISHTTYFYNSSMIYLARMSISICFNSSFIDFRSAYFTIIKRIICIKFLFASFTSFNPIVNPFNSFGYDAIIRNIQYL